MEVFFICGVLAVSTDPGELCASVKWILVKVTQSIRLFFFFFPGGGCLPTTLEVFVAGGCFVVSFRLVVLREPQRAAQSITIHSWRRHIGFKWNKRLLRDRPSCPLTEEITADKGVLWSPSNSAIVNTAQQDLPLTRITFELWYFWVRSGNLFSVKTLKVLWCADIMKS